VKLLDDQHLQKPKIDWTKEEFWPKIVLWSRDERERGRPGREQEADGDEDQGARGTQPGSPGPEPEADQPGDGPMGDN
jgi:hypothetical protein